MVLGLGAGDIERPCPEWEPYVEPLRLRMFEIRKQAQEAGLEAEEALGYGANAGDGQPEGSGR